MRKTVSRILWIAAGVALIAAGIFCLAHPSAAVAGMSMLLGLVLLLSGIADIAAFAVGQRYMAGAGWFLADGIVTVLLSLFLLCHRAFTALTLPLLLGMWLLFSGVIKFANSFDLQRLGVRGWGWFTAAGILLAICGFCSLANPLAGMVAAAILIGVLLILQGVASILRGCFSPRFWL